MNEIELESEGVVIDTSPDTNDKEAQKVVEPQEEPIEVEEEQVQEEITVTVEEEEERSFFPKLIREVKDVNEDTVEVCPSLLMFNRKIQFKCRKIKRRKK